MKKYKKILIFQTGEPTHFDKSNAPMRLINLSEKLSKENYLIDILTPDFSHQEKKFRNIQHQLFINDGKIKYTYIKSPGYKNNISISRLFDHIVLAINLKKELKKFNNIDYVFIGYPPIEACFVLSRWCNKNNIPYMIDYKDYWPEIFLYQKNLIFKILSYPLIFLLKLMRDYSIKNSKSISTISKIFLTKYFDDNIKKKTVVCYLTKEKKKQIVEKWVKHKIKSYFLSNKIKIVFIGNFMVDAFDFKVLNQIKTFIINSKNLEIYLFGSGPSKEKILSFLNFKNVFISDRVNFEEFQYIMKNSDAVFLPIKNRFDYINSLPNKVIDAIQYRLPIFTSLQGETKFLIEKYNLGFVYNDYKDLQSKLQWYCQNNNANIIKKNFYNKAIENLFNHDFNYKKIVNRIKLDLESKRK